MLLLKYPSIITLCSFSKNCPSEEEVESASFKMWFIGHGLSNESLAANENSKPDVEVITRITELEMGDVTMPVIMVGQLICKKDFNKIEYLLMSSRKASFLLDCCSSLFVAPLKNPNKISAIRTLHSSKN